MRLLSVGPPGQERPAALDDQDVLRDLSAAVPRIDGDLLGDPVRLRLIHDLVASGRLPAVAEGTRIGPPVARPGKVVGVGLNYEDHAEEAGVAIPDEPVVFLKPSTSIVGPYDAIELPPGSTTTDYEVELGVVLGRRLSRCADPQQALAAVGGYLTADDVSERARIAAGPTWAKGKCADTFTPIGPWLVTADAVDDPQALGLELWVDGERRQAGSTARMAQSVGEILAFLSTLMTLESGDLVLTGTPGGVAALRPEPRPFLREGHVVEAEVTGLGRQRTRVVAVEERAVEEASGRRGGQSKRGEGVSRQIDLVIRASRMVTPDGETTGSVGVRDGEIVAVDTTGAGLTAARVVELADDEVLMPGVVDAHVHVNDPGRTEWEGFASATRAAAAGGVTTIVDMPLNSIPPTCDLPALDLKRRVALGGAAASQAFVDIGFWGGAIPGNVPELRTLHEAGVSGFKCFLLHSGVDEFPPLDADQLELAMREIASFDGLLIVHAEDAHAIEHAPVAVGGAYAGFLHSRPRDAENLAVAGVVEVARKTGCRVHILHVSSADVLATIDAARRDGIPITAETCPHYLTFAAEEIPDGATQFKCCPPIREAANRELLWVGLREGVIDMVVTDHSPSTPDLKALDTGDFGVAWGGISSLQLGLSAVWTEARSRGFTLTDVARWMSEAPARHAGLSRKGRIAVGNDADFCVLAPDDTYVVDAAKLHHKNAVTPYHGRTLAGVVRETWLRGEKIDIEAAPQGRLLTREGARP